MNTTSPERLIQSIHAALAKDARINLAASELEIRPSGYSLALEGRVETIAAKRIITNLAQQIAGAEYRIEDRLRVSTEDISDPVLRDKIIGVLTNEPVFSNYRILTEIDGREERLRDPDSAAGTLQVSLHQGVVSLSGEVGSITHCRLAEVLIWWIPGCQRVDNQLRVVPPEYDSDDELTDAVKIVLEKDPLIHAGQLRVGTAAGVVELDGLLPSEDEHILALLDTWAVPGVWEVYDRIEVGRLG